VELTRLRHIVAVARNRSFSRAAEETGITQPALSRSIAAFETRYRVKLFDRGRGGVHPTAAGLNVIAHAEKLLTASRDFERSLTRYPNGAAGKVAFGLGPLLSSLFLPRLAHALLNDLPGIQIVALSRAPDQLVTELLADRIELILGNNWNLGRVPGTEVRRLGKLDIAVMVRAGHPLAEANTVSLADLERFPVASAVELPAGSLGGAGSFVCDNFHVLRDAVLGTDCSWMSSPAFLSEELRTGAIIQLEVIDFQSFDSDVCLVSKRGRTLSPAAAAMLDQVRDLIDQ
jgi:DNA-binding transcriptional LysR family regulator